MTTAANSVGISACGNEPKPVSPAEQVGPDIAALREAVSPLLSGVLTAFPYDLDEGDLEEVEVTFTRRQIKAACRLFGVDPVVGSAFPTPPAEGSGR